MKFWEIGTDEDQMPFLGSVHSNVPGEKSGSDYQEFDTTGERFQRSPRVKKKS